MAWAWPCQALSLVTSLSTTLFSSFPSPHHPVSRASLSRLLYDSLSLSAWKTIGFSTWSLLVNPSSGNLHPTEAHLLSSPLLDGDSPFSFSFLAHYSPKDHSLELRARLDLSSPIMAAPSFSSLSPPSFGTRPGSTTSVPSVNATTTSATPSSQLPSPRLPSAGMPASSTASTTMTSTSSSASTVPTLRRLPSSPSTPFTVAAPGSSPNIRTAPSSSFPSAPYPLSITLRSMPPCPTFRQWSGSERPVLSARTMFAGTSSPHYRGCEEAINSL